MDQLLQHPPPMPWRLRAHGVTLITLHKVDVDRARAWVPPEYPILQFWPGKTIGGLWAAKYGPGSDLQYNELIAACATVWYRGRPAPWATHLYVDNPLSVRGGRELIGAPKHLAPFTSDTSARTRITIGDPQRPICRISYGRQLWVCRMGVRLPALHLDFRNPGRVSVHGNEVRGRIGLTHANVEIPEDSPLRALGLGRPLVSVCGRELEAVFGGAPFLPHRSVPILTPSPEAATLQP